MAEHTDRSRLPRGAAGSFGRVIEYLQPSADFAKSIGHPIGDQHQAQIDEWRRKLESADSASASD